MAIGTITPGDHLDELFGQLDEGGSPELAHKFLKEIDIESIELGAPDTEPQGLNNSTIRENLSGNAIDRLGDADIGAFATYVLQAIRRITNAANLLLCLSLSLYECAIDY
jgi:hypothetical protein